MSGDLPVLPLGELHPRDRCYLCGTRAGALILVVTPETRAQARRCVDAVACVRREQRLRTIRRFGKASMRRARRAA